ncbi:MAG: hypothetical protein ABL982_21380, partial [Vicinamibacterales bacterium]
VTSNTSLAIAFAGGVLDSTSVAGRVRMLGPTGTPLGANVSAAGGFVLVSAPVGGWPSGDLTLELHAGIRSTDGDEMPAPLALPFRRP